MDEDITKIKKIIPKIKAYADNSAYFLNATLNSITQRKRYQCGRYVLIDFGHHVLFFDTKEGYIDYFAGTVVPMPVVNSKVYVVLEHGMTIGYFDFGEENLQFYYHYNEFGE